MPTLDNFLLTVLLQGQTSLALDLGETVSKLVGFDRKMALTNGTGNKQANELWSDKRNLAASADDDLDLAGVLTNAYGTVITFTVVKFILVRNNSQNAGTILTVGATVANSIADYNCPCGHNGIVIPVCEPDAGITVTGGTGDLLRITNEDGVNAADYEIVVAGEV